MSAVQRITPHVQSMRAPTELRSLEGWLVWRYEAGDGPKPRKVPHYANGGKRTVNGTAEDRAKLVTFDAARAAAARRGFDGVGLAIMPEFGLVALDFDHAIVDGGLDPQVESLVAGTYAEWSPSGTGVRAFFKGTGLPNAKSKGPGFGFETFSTLGYVTFTSNALESVDLLGCEDRIAPVTSAVRELYRARFGERPQDVDDPLMSHQPRLGLTVSTLREMLGVLSPDLSHDEWLHAGMGVHHETEGSEEGFALWLEWSAQGEKFPGEHKLRHRWDSFGRPDRAGRVVTARSLVTMANAAGYRVDLDAPASPAELEAAASEEGAPSRFKVVPAGEFASGTPTGWIVKGLLPAAELCVLYGESGAGKSFVALDIALAIAQGVPWRGMRTRRGRVVYVAAEGAGGVRGRLAAYASHHGIDLTSVDLGVVADVPNLLQREDAVALARAVGRGASVVIIDTLAQTTAGGNENSGEDMGRAIAHARGIHRATGALVIVIHHAGKDTSKGARGWSGLRAAADAELEVIRDLQGRRVQVRKQKDGDDTGVWGFDLEPVNIGVDEDGDPVASCVVVESAVGVVGVIARPVGAIERAVLDVVQGLGDRAQVDQVVELAATRLEAPPDGSRDTRKQRVRRAIATLSAGDDAPFWVSNGVIERV